MLRLLALALADGGSLPFSLYPPQAALESQTRQRKVLHSVRRACRHRRRAYGGAGDAAACENRQQNAESVSAEVK